MNRVQKVRASRETATGCLCTVPPDKDVLVMYDETRGEIVTACVKCGIRPHWYISNPGVAAAWHARQLWLDWLEIKHDKGWDETFAAAMEQLRIAAQHSAPWQVMTWAALNAVMYSQVNDDIPTTKLNAVAELVAKFPEDI